MALMNNGTSFNPEHNNRSAHTPHLLDAPVQGAHAQSSNQLAPSAPVMVQQQQQNQDFKPLNSPSQKSSSIGVSFHFDEWPVVLVLFLSYYSHDNFVVARIIKFIF